MTARARGKGASAPASPPEGQRLQKVLARAGVGSRRAVEQLISEGRVRVNGVPARLGDRVNESRDRVEVDGSPIILNPALVHYLLNKPEGVVTTGRDPEGRTTVLDLVDVPQRVWPAGRLDVATEGALILTNDGELTQCLTHPRHRIRKTYVAEVAGDASVKTLTRLAAGVELEDGPTAPAEVALLDRVPGGTLIELTISEGRNRQVRRMFEAMGHPVRRLARTGIGPLMLGRLKPGSFRKLGPHEVSALLRECQGTLSDKDL